MGPWTQPRLPEPPAGYQPQSRIPPEEDLPDWTDWPLAGSPPPGYDPDCELCNLDAHRCPGCGQPLRHGVTACRTCDDQGDAYPGGRAPEDDWLS